MNLDSVLIFFEERDEEAAESKWKEALDYRCGLGLHSTRTYTLHPSALFLFRKSFCKG